MKKSKEPVFNPMYTLLGVIATAIVGFVIAKFLVPILSDDMNKDLGDARAYLERLSANLIDTPLCQSYKQKMLSLAPEGSKSTDGAVLTPILKVYDAAGSAGCKKNLQ